MTRTINTAPTPSANGYDHLADGALVAELLALISGGRLSAAAHRLEQVTLEPRSRALVEADLAVRSSAIEVTALDDLRTTIEAHDPPGSPQWAWVRAIVAERLFLDLDPAAVALAVASLGDVAPDPIGPVALVFAKARLLRVASSGWIGLPSPDGLRFERAMRDEAVRLLNRCGFAAEVAATIALASGMHAMIFNDGISAAIDALLAARTSLDDAEQSIWAPAFDHLIGALALASEEVEVADAALARLERSSVTLPRTAGLSAFGRAILRVQRDGPDDDAVAALGAALEDMRSDPVLHPLRLRVAAHALADLNHPGASRYAREANALPPLGPVDLVDREVLDRHVDLLEGRPVPMDQLRRPLDTLVAAGRSRVAARSALALAGDLRRHGAATDAETMAAWADRHLPLAPERTPAEYRLAERARPTISPGAPDGLAAPPADLVVRALDARLAVSVRATPAALGSLPALLLLTLVVEHPTPVHVERISYRLWPGAPYDRSRVNTIVYRLRQALEPVGHAVRRQGSGLVLDDALVDSDLWRYRRALGGSPTERAGAVRGVRGLLGEAELPYDEALTDSRRAFVAEWTAEARALLATGHLTITDLGPTLAALGLVAADVGTDAG